MTTSKWELNPPSERRRGVGLGEESLEPAHLPGEDPAPVPWLHEQGEELPDGPLRQLENRILGEVSLAIPGMCQGTVLGCVDEGDTFVEQLQGLGQALPSRTISEFLEALGCQAAQQEHGLGKGLECCQQPWSVPGIPQHAQAFQEPAGSPSYPPHPCSLFQLKDLTGKQGRKGQEFPFPCHPWRGEEEVWFAPWICWSFPPLVSLPSVPLTFAVSARTLLVAAARCSRCRGLSGCSWSWNAASTTSLPAWTRDSPTGHTSMLPSWPESSDSLEWKGWAQRSCLFPSPTSAGGCRLLATFSISSQPPDPAGRLPATSPPCHSSEFFHGFG